MKELGEKVLGWFIVAEDDAPKPKPKPAAPAKVHAPVAPPPRVGGSEPRSFGDVYRAAGLVDADRERVTKVLDLLAALPDGAPAEVKRAIVVASLEAFGVSIDSVVAAASAADAALDGYALEGRRRTEHAIAEATARIDALSAKIGDEKKHADVALRSQEELANSVARERARLRAIAAFFGKSGN